MLRFCRPRITHPLAVSTARSLLSLSKAADSFVVVRVSLNSVTHCSISVVLLSLPTDVAHSLWVADNRGLVSPSSNLPSFCFCAVTFVSMGVLLV